MKAAVISILCIFSAAILISMLKSGHFVKALAVSGLQGIVSLAAVNVSGLVTGVVLSINWYTVGFVSLAGIPGTVCLTVMKLILN